ncbi:oligosaccharide flippase family protein [Devosia sp.]|uniref:lipopolysaccharide biosynthesis protein n=1 Tax=Devosia sp. TaxID=1871048 RepID=UPI001B2361FB|nr:oligosaccharide flippase family protein [Devosia sp.]MBO9591143.1 oligosaccharide flippase family protein [Devosia sp.]
MSIVRAFAADFSVYAASRIIAATAWVATVWVLTSNLAPSQYAQFWQVFTLVTGTASLATSWLVTAQRRFYARFEKNNELHSYVETSVVSAKICLGLSLVVFVIFLGANWAYDLVVLDFTQWMGTAIAFVLCIIFLIYCGHLIAARKPRQYLLFSAGQSILLLAALYTALNFAGGNGVTWSVVVFAASYGIFLLVAGWHEHVAGTDLWSRVVLLWNERALGYSTEYLRFGLPLVLMNLAFLLSNLGTQIIVQNLHSASAAGIYAAYYAPIERIVGFVTAIAATALIPLLANHWEQGHQRQALRFLGLVILATTTATGAIAAIIVIAGDAFASNMVGTEYLSGVELIAPTAVSCFLFGIASIIADVLIIKRRTLLLALMFVVAVVIGLTTAVVIVPEQAALGGAYARVVSSLASVVLVGGAAVFVVWRDFSVNRRGRMGLGKS